LALEHREAYFQRIAAGCLSPLPPAPAASTRELTMGYINCTYDEQAVPSELLEDFVLLGQAIGSAFRSLTRIRFEAPWGDYRGIAR
jgi:hypothetical protein